MKKFIMVLLSGMLWSVFLSAQDIPPRPEPPRLVNDLAGILQSDQAGQLEVKLEDFSNTTSNQIAVVIVKSLNGYDESEFAYTIGEKWGVGKKNFNNGIVVLVKPKYGNEKGEVFIATGYGLEGAIPDAVCRRIIENEMIPRFREGNYYAGIDAATNVLMKLAKGEISVADYKKGADKGAVGIVVAIVVVLIVLLIIRISNGKGNMNNMGGKNLPFWTLLFLAMNSGRGRGSWGGFSGGGGFGGGGGGFGGFGGGSFGGGGAGGSW